MCFRGSPRTNFPRYSNRKEKSPSGTHSCMSPCLVLHPSLAFVSALLFQRLMSWCCFESFPWLENLRKRTKNPSLLRDVNAARALSQSARFVPRISLRRPLSCEF